VHNRRRIVPVYRVPAVVRALRRKVGGTQRCANHIEIGADPLLI
jgi:hypothetical protein